MDHSRLLYIHGSESSGHAFKANVLRDLFPELITPDFTGPLSVRMAQLRSIMKDEPGWILIGSSLGGLIAALYTAQYPAQISKVVLLAPALHLPEFTRHLPKPQKAPAILVIGKKDDVIPVEKVHLLAQKVFPHLTYLSVDDDHRLHHAVNTLDWESLFA